MGSSSSMKYAPLIRPSSDRMNDRSDSSRAVVTLCVRVCWLCLPVYHDLSAAHRCRHRESVFLPLLASLVTAFACVFFLYCLSFGTKSVRKENTVKSTDWTDTAAPFFYLFAFSLVRVLESFSSQLIFITSALLSIHTRLQFNLNKKPFFLYKIIKKVKIN